MEEHDAYRREARNSALKATGGSALVVTVVGLSLWRDAVDEFGIDMNEPAPAVVRATAPSSSPLAPHSDLSLMVSGPVDFKGPDGNIRAELETVGTLMVSEGAICVGEPGLSTSCTTLDRQVPSGSFPVQVSIVSLPIPFNKNQPAGAVVRFADASVTSWEPAIPSDAEPSEYRDALWASVTNFGLIGFGDPKEWSKVDAFHADLPSQPPYDLGWQTWNDGAMVGFHNHHAEYAFPWWGIDEDDHVVALALDFAILHRDGRPMSGTPVSE